MAAKTALTKTELKATFTMGTIVSSLAKKLVFNPLLENNVDASTTSTLSSQTSRFATS